MIIDLLWYVRISESFAILLGLILVYLSIHAFRNVRQVSFLYSAAGFAAIIVSSLMEGLFVDFLESDVLTAHAVRVTFFAFGFLMLIYSIRKIQ